MVKLILHNGTELTFADGGQNGVVGEYDTYAAVDDIRPLITNENLIGAKIVYSDGATIKLENTVTNGISTWSDYSGKVQAHFNLRQKTEVELLQEQINAIHSEQEIQNEALDYLAME